MKRIKLAFVLVLIVLTGCTAPSTPARPPSNPALAVPANTVADVVALHRLTLEAPATLIHTTLPASLESAEWSLKDAASSNAGYDLRAAAGSGVVLLRFPIAQRYRSEPLYLWLVARGDTLVGAYLTVREGSSPVPGVFSLNDPDMSGRAPSPAGRPNKRIERTP